MRSVPLWQKTEEELGEIGLPPPFWAFAWAGGQALARYVMDHPEVVRGKHVIDLASGSGLVGIAAMKAGAAHVFAADIDGFAVAAMTERSNVRQGNDVRLADNGRQFAGSRCASLRHHPRRRSVLRTSACRRRSSTGSQHAKAQGTPCSDRRSGPQLSAEGQTHRLAEYNVPVTRDLEDAEIKRTAVWTTGVMPRPVLLR